MQRCFGSVVHGPPGKWYDAGDGPDLHDSTLGLAKERHEGLAQAHHGEEVGIEDGFDLGFFGFDGWHRVIWIGSVCVDMELAFLCRCSRTLASIVHQVVQLAPRSL